MRTLQPLVKQLLERTGINVSYRYPASWTKLPCITWYEAGNRELAQTDAREDMTELTYVVDIWAMGPEELAEVATLVDGELSAARFKRTFSQDVYDVKAQYHHRAMRYRAVMDIYDNIYQ